MEIHLRKLGTDNLKDTFTYKFRRINDIAFSYCCMIQESLLNASKLKCEAGMSITRLTCFPRWKSTSSWHSFIQYAWQSALVICISLQYLWDKYPAALSPQNIMVFLLFSCEYWCCTAQQHIGSCLTFWTLPFPKIRISLGVTRKHTETACKPPPWAGVSAGV